MAVYRTVWINFWTDPKIDDDFTPEDKYFYLYLLTNPHTNICGCYEVGMRQMSRETGYNEDAIKRLLERMKSVHKVIDYDLDNKEIFILNWYKYNWNNSGDTLNGVLKVADKIKTDSFREELFSIIDELKKDGNTFNIGSKKGKNKGVLRGSNDTRKTSVTDTVTESIKEIIDYLNTKCNKKYTYKNKNYNSKIHARLKEGFTVEDFKTVIDKKYDEWVDTEFEKYLDPDTLFAPSKFEKYLNQKGERNGRKRMETEHKESVDPGAAFDIRTLYRE